MRSTITNADRNRWQHTAALVLVDVLTRARDTDLPPLSWMVACGGGLIGRAADVRHGDRRTTFELWVGFLRAHSSPDRITPAGWRHLHAVASWPTPTGVVVPIVLLADLDPHDPLTEQET